MTLIPRLLAVLTAGLLSTGCVLHAHPGHGRRHQRHYDHDDGHHGRGHQRRDRHRHHTGCGHDRDPGPSISVGLGHVCVDRCDHAWDGGDWRSCHHHDGCGHALIGGRWVFELR